uniref:Exportin-T n=1 Tax=Macrostomum lignano TaxID=282301 RepID=A0A1I8GEL5_9PLAT
MDSGGSNGDSLDWNLLAGLRLDASQSERHKATVYFEELRSRPDGWLLCARLLLESGSAEGQSGRGLGAGLDDNVKYFCLQVIEHYLRTGYKCNSGPEQHAQVRQFLAGWSGNFINGNVEEKSYVRNKVAQLYSLAFVVDYPQRWPTFIEDLAGTLVYGDRAVDLFLRILHTIDGDVVDREIPHTAEENARNAAIKDRMRETCFLAPNSIVQANAAHQTQLADVWYWILTSGGIRTDLVCLCLDVVALYASWIDIGLLANQRYADLFLALMGQPLCRESVCSCLSALVAKGMPAEAKVSLVESYAELLKGAGLMDPSDSESGDYLASLGKLIGALGLQLVRCFVKLYPPAQQLQPEQAEQRQRLINCIEAKLPLAIRLLGNEDDDVSHSVLEFCQEYVGLLKSLRGSNGAGRNGSGGGDDGAGGSAGSSSGNEAGWVRQLLGTVISKLQLDESYDAESPGEEEAMFDEYRRDLKVLFGNLVALDGPLVLTICSEFVAHLLPRWQSVSPAQTEVAVYLLHLLGEFLPPSKSGDHFVASSGGLSSGGAEQPALFTGMLVSLVTSQVSRCQHPLVTLRYFETVVRYEKFFVHNTQFVPEVLMSFLDERGLQSSNLMIRSRVSYLLSRFVKCHKHQLRGYTQEILAKLQPLLRPRNVVLPAVSPTGDGSGDFASSLNNNNDDNNNPPLSPSDQMFLFESAALLIVSSGIEPQQKRALFEALLSPLLQ